MAGRTIAIGDVHGCSAALAALIDVVAPGHEDTVVTLGDYVDRGPDSRGVLDRLIALARRCRLVPILGNHDEMLLDALHDPACLKRWLTCGGGSTLKSYGWTPGGPRTTLARWIPDPHRAFLMSCRPYYETATHLFTHAGYVPDLPAGRRPPEALRWRVTDPRSAVPHESGKVVVVGHTPQLSGEVLDLGFLVCVDTNCARGGWLTAYDAGSGGIRQADQGGRVRAGTGAPRPPAPGAGRGGG